MTMANNIDHGNTVPYTFQLVAEPRGIRAPLDKPTNKSGMLNDWQPDPDFRGKRWPEGKKPDIATMRSPYYQEVAKEASRLNSAQINAGFLDWLYSVRIEPAP